MTTSPDILRNRVNQIADAISAIFEGLPRRSQHLVLNAVIRQLTVRRDTLALDLQREDSFDKS